jgi:hypothetical protein
MGGACSAYGGEERFIKGLVGKREGKNHLGDPGVDGTIKLNIYLREVGWGMDLIDLAQYRYRCRALVNAVMNHRVP